MKLSLAFTASCLVQICLCSDWGYFSGYVPSEWHHVSEDCSGDSQSPIDIRHSVSTTFDDDDDCELLFSGDWNRRKDFDIENNGHSVEVDVTEGDYWTKNCRWGKYEVLQFHFHWGCNNSVGSEHKLDGERFPMEMHIVHQDTSHEGTGELAVLGFFFEITSHHNRHLDPITDELHVIEHPGDSSTVDDFNLYHLIKDALDESYYYQYDGSLTTPPCSETVKWNVFSKPLGISQHQLNLFRSVKWHDCPSGGLCPMCDNYRPLQPRNDRPIFRAKAEGEVDDDDE